MVIKVPASKKLLPAISVIVLLGALGSYITFRGNGSSDKKVTTKQVFQEPKTGLKLEYPAGLRKSELSTEDTKSNILLRMVEEQGQKPMLITVRSETGLRVATTLSKQALLPLLMNNSERAFPQRFKGFTKVSSRTFELNNTKAGEILFTYDGPDGSKSKQRFIIYPKDDDTAIYVAMQAKEADFDQVNAETFNPIVSTLKF